MIHCLCLLQTVLPLMLQFFENYIVLNGLYVPKLLTYPRRKIFYQPHRVKDLRIDVDALAMDLSIGLKHHLMNT